jgi:hypothetical protein
VISETRLAIEDLSRSVAAGLVGWALHVAPNGVRDLVAQAEIVAGMRPGPTSEQLQRLRDTEDANRRLHRDNEILAAATRFMVRELDDPAAMLGRFVDFQRITHDLDTIHAAISPVRLPGMGARRASEPSSPEPDR